jgi:hypothetical protein
MASKTRSKFLWTCLAGHSLLFVTSGKAQRRARTRVANYSLLCYTLCTSLLRLFVHLAKGLECVECVLNGALRLRQGCVHVVNHGDFSSLCTSAMCTHAHCRCAQASSDACAHLRACNLITKCICNVSVFSACTGGALFGCSRDEASFS